MKKNCAFTICTKSYIGLAKTLRDSFLQFNDDFDFYIIFCDYDVSNETYILNGEDIVALGKEKYLEMAFKYNVTEFCTAIKPFGFTYMFNKGYSKVAYFDPDILFFSKFNELYENFSVFLTPHILNVMTKIKNNWPEESFLKYGIYNCGFIGLNNDINGRFVAKWWGENLVDKAFSDSDSGLYTDQKWIDMVPSFIPLDKIKVIKNMGCDLAPWNYFERKVINNNNKYIVVNRENEEIKNDICFVHFSAYNYKELLKNKIIQTTYELNDYPDTDVLLFLYRDKLLENNTLAEMNIKYKFNYYDNEMPILLFHRRIYRQFLKEKTDFSNPFSTTNTSFYSLLKKNKLIVQNDVSQKTKNNINGYSRKNKMINNMFKSIYKVLGVNKYVLLLRKLNQISRYENNTFLIKKK